MTYLTNRSGCAKKSAYISNKDLLSRMKVGSTTCLNQERSCEGEATGDRAGRRTWSGPAHLGEVHAQADLREKVHDDALVLLHGLALAVVVAVVVAVERV